MLEQMDRTCAPDQSLFINGEEDKRFLKYQSSDKDELYQVGELLEVDSMMINKGRRQFDG
jgi:hypothetical protein